MSLCETTRTVYVTTDGKEFTSHSAAEAWEAANDLQAWADEMGICRGGPWNQDMVVAAIRDSAKVLQPIITALAAG